MEIELAKIIFLCLAFAFGAIFGSFACCQAWRLHLKEVDRQKISQTTVGKRSICMSCRHQLSVLENIPIFSWLLLRGKCKKCGKKIGLSEILSELSLGLVFLAIGFLLWPSIISTHSFSWNIVIYYLSCLILIVALVLLWILMVYDAKWGKLPTNILISLIIASLLIFIMRVVSIFISGTASVDLAPLIYNTLSSIGILALIYYLLYKLSKEKLVGSGDWLLALAISVILGHWWLALITLFISNFTASIYGIIQKLQTGKSVVFFGPFLIIAFVVVLIFQNALMKLLS